MASASILGFAYALWLFVPYARTYFLFLLGSYMFAYFVYCRRGENPSKLFDKSVWFHETSLNEAYILIISYLFVSLVINKGYIFSPEPFVHFFHTLFSKLNFSVPSNAQPSTLISIVYIIAIVFARDAAYYSAHRLMHTSRILWEFHKVHHSAQVMTPFTSLRQHPVELMLNYLFGAFFIGFIASIFIYFFYPSIAGALVVVQSQIFLSLFMLLGGSLAHSHAWISYGPLNNYIISPAMHQIHHSTNPRHFNKNYGFMLVCFDRWFGTVYIPEEREDIEFGIGGGQDKGFVNLKGAMISPFVRAFKRLRRS